MNIFARLRRSYVVSYVILLSLLSPLFPRTAHADDNASLPNGFASEVQLGQVSNTTQTPSSADQGPFVSAGVDPATGALGASIPFQLPAARGDVQPSLSLSYSSTAGWGVGGMGWSLSLPSIERQNASGPPNYANDPAPYQRITPSQDRFVFNGRPLVPVCFIPSDLPGCLSLDPTPETLPTWAVAGWHYYRLETEDGSHLRFFWSGDHTMWVVQAPNGSTMEFGVPQGFAGTNSGTDVEPSAGSSTAIFRWNLVQQYDAQRTGGGGKTNAIEYVWASLVVPGTKTPTLLSYLTDIYYTPPVGATSPATSTFANHVHLNYVPAPAASVQNFSPVWRARRGFLVSTVDVTAQTWAGGGPREQIRRYLFTYRTSGTRDLEQVQIEGWCGSTSPQLEDATTQLLSAEPSGGTNCPTLKPTTFSATFPGPVSSTLMPIADLPGLSAPQFLDFNLDGLPDLVVNSSTDTQEVYFGPNFGALPLGVVGSSTGAAPITGSRAPWASPMDEQYNAGTFGSTGGLGVLWMQGFDPAEFHPTSATPSQYRDESFYLPRMADATTLGTGVSGTTPQWLADTTVGGRILWAQQDPTTPSAFEYLNKYANADVDGDGLTDMIVASVGYEQPTNGNVPPDPAVGNVSVLFSRRTGPAYVSAVPWTLVPSTSGGAPDWQAGDSNVCVGGTQNGGVLFGKSNNSGGSGGDDDDDDDNPGYDATSPPNSFADMNGDGIPDWILMTTTSLSVAYGRGDGWFGQCADGTQACACRSATSAPYTLPVSDISFAHIHDIDGDGLADLIVPSTTGFTYYQNVGGAFDTAGVPVDVTGAFGWANANTPPGSTTFAFADVDGSGVDDVVMMNNSQATGGRTPSDLPASIGYVLFNGPESTSIPAYRPGLLNLIFDENATVTTNIEYQRITETGTPQTLTVVSQLTVAVNAGSVSLSPPSVTQYSYFEPAYDWRDRQFVGFHFVETFTTGDPVSDPTTHVSTQFYQGVCEDNDQPANPCPTTADYPNHSLRDLPVVTIVDNATTLSSATAVSLSTVHRGYTATVLYQGLDGRSVRRVYESATDDYLFDPSNPAPLNVQASLPDVTLGGAALPSQSFVDVTSNAIHTVKTFSPDPWGLTTSTDDQGAASETGAYPDGIIRTVVTSAPAAQDNTDYWIWRNTDELITGVVGGVPSGTAHEVSYDYDSRGNMLHVYSPLSGTLPVTRWHETGAPVAGQPPVYSSDGNVTLVHLTYVPDGSGNVQRVEQPGTSGCSDYGYDAAFSQVRTTAKTYLEGCDTNYTATLVANYERGLGVPLDETEADGERTVVTQLDAFGRPLKVQEPDVTIPGQVEATASLTFDYRDNEYPRKIHTTVSVSGTTQEYWQYIDGLGRELLTLSPADPSNGDPSSWIISGALQRSAKGNVLTSFTPQCYTSGTDPDSVPLPITGVSVTAKYDAFGRQISASDIDGTVLYQRIYQPLGYIIQDAEQLLPPGPSAPHAGYSTTVGLDSHGRVAGKTLSGFSVETIEQYAYLPTGELSSVTRIGSAATGNVWLTQRWMQYDSFGRMVLNAEPNTTLNFSGTQPAPAAMKAWTYAYDDAGRLVGTVDARGCGENIAYDGAGRIQFEDYSPCLAAQAPYTPVGSGGSGAEALYSYDDQGMSASLALGRATDLRDRAQHSTYGYDGRSRVTSLTRHIAAPSLPSAGASVRYSTASYVKSMQYDSLDRLTQEGTGATAVALQSFGIALPGDPTYGAGAIVGSYSPRGILTYITGAYGDLVTGVKLEADGRTDSIQYADNASTTLTNFYNDKRNRLTESTVWRSPGFASADAVAAFTAATTLADDLISQPGGASGYDAVSNPIAITDNRLATEWPQTAQPVPPRSLTYDDQYRLVQTSSATATPGTYLAPIAADTAHSSPVPMSTVSTRLQSQSFTYNGLGDSLSSTDDQNVFFDRSLGSITNSGAPTAPGPNQISSASLASSVSGNTGSLGATYDAAGNVVQIAVTRNGTCTPAAGCSQLFRYDWDEVGRLAQSRRYDLDAAGPASYAYPNLPASEPAANVVYTYDASGKRVIRGPGDANSDDLYSVEIFPSLRLDDASWNGEAYDDTVDTEGVYMTLGGMSLGRVVGDVPVALSPSNNSTHVFLEIADGLGSTSSVVDVESGELVEQTTYQAYGATESDYRPDRWNGFRERYKFTGKEDDVEMGVTYFGARYYSPFLGRWMSPDPVAIHNVAGDLNPYAYVHGRVTTTTDPLGLMGSDDDGSDDTSNWVCTDTGCKQDPVVTDDGKSTSQTEFWHPPLKPPVETPNAGAQSPTDISGPQPSVAKIALGALATTAGYALGGATGGRVNENGGGYVLIRSQPSPAKSYVISSIYAASTVAPPGVKAALGAGIAGLKSFVASRFASVTGGTVTKGAAAVARTFTSADPLVADLANKIEAAYPGHVVGVNVPIKNAAGNMVTDVDILLKNAAIQVKSGSGAGLTRQVLVTQSATGLPTIGYGPQLGGSVVKGIQAAGGLVTRDEQVLIQVVAP